MEPVVYDQWNYLLLHVDLETTVLITLVVEKGQMHTQNEKKPKQNKINEKAKYS